MCKISDKIKFCTCGTENNNFEEFENYWILYRYKYDNNLELIIDEDTIVGSFMISVNEEFDEINKTTILNRLKDPDAFDIDIQFKEEDCLVIFLNKNSFELVYCFNYLNAEWHIGIYDQLALNVPNSLYRSGKLDDAIEIKKSQI